MSPRQSQRTLACHWRPPEVDDGAGGSSPRSRNERRHVADGQNRAHRRELTGRREHCCWSVGRQAPQSEGQEWNWEHIGLEKTLSIVSAATRPEYLSLTAASGLLAI